MYNIASAPCLSRVWSRAQIDQDAVEYELIREEKLEIRVKLPILFSVKKFSLWSPDDYCMIGKKM